MKFCDKLAKKRKENNLSQEQLADKLKMSRQAISKWESGSSYPDMNTIMELCKILNCTLDELLDDGSLGEKVPKEKSNINNWIKEIREFVTKTYNMFCSMAWGGRIKCLFEMAVATFILIILAMILRGILGSLFSNLLYLLPDSCLYVVKNIATFIYEIFAAILGFLVILHIYKIRYLDYFVVVEDKDAEEKTIEEPIKENKGKKKVLFQEPKEKIIIRDKVHTSYNFITAIGKILLFIIKIFAAFVSLFFIFTFLCGSFGLVFSIFSLQYGIFFLGCIISVLGLLMINYSVLEMLYCLIFSLNYHFKRIFIIFIVGIFLSGAGVAFSTVNYLSFDTDKSLNNVTEYIDYKDKMLLNFEYEIVIDNSLDNIKVEYPQYDSLETALASNTADYGYISYTFRYDDENMVNVYQALMYHFKNKIQIEENFYNVCKVYISQSNYDKLVASEKKYYNNFN